MCNPAQTNAPNTYNPAQANAPNTYNPAQANAPNMYNPVPTNAPNACNPAPTTNAPNTYNAALTTNAPNAYSSQAAPTNSSNMPILSYAAANYANNAAGSRVPQIEIRPEHSKQIEGTVKAELEAQLFFSPDLVCLMKYSCGYCGKIKVSASALISGRVRIRCECGGKNQDNVSRMHAMWNAVKADEKNDEPLTFKNLKPSVKSWLRLICLASFPLWRRRLATIFGYV